MILVTVGTEKYPFNRLMEWIDNLIIQGFLNLEQEEVVIQYGSCTVVPAGVQNHTVLPETDFLSLVEEARIIIAHCGEGTMDLLDSVAKPFILVPRQGEKQEHVDDHQLELARELEKQAVPIAYSQKDLACFLANPVLAEFSVTPAAYYAQVGLFLEEEFETDSIRAELLEDLVGTAQLTPAFE